MKTNVNSQIAVVHLTSRLRQTIVAVLGVTFGISMYIFMNSFMNGVNEIQTDLAFSSLAHIRIYNDIPKDKESVAVRFFGNSKLVNVRNEKKLQYTEGIPNATEIITLLNKQPEVTGVTPQVNLNVFFRSSSKKVNGIISGVNTKSENQLFGIAEKIEKGDWKTLQYETSGLIMGVLLADKLGVTINDNVNVLTPDGITRNFKVIGIIKTSIGDIDKTKAFLNITAAQQLLSENRDYATDIQVNIKDYQKAINVVNRLAPVIPYQVDSWNMANQQLEAASGLRDIIAIAVSLTILIVAGFGIYNIMNMTINEKIKEIAILKAMGFSGGDVTNIFLLQAIFIGIVGGLVGIAFGFMVTRIVDQIPFVIAGLENLPVSYRLIDYTLAFLFGLLTTVIAGYLPAKKAAEVDPVTIIRG